MRVGERKFSDRRLAAWGQRYQKLNGVGSSLCRSFQLVVVPVVQLSDLNKAMTFTACETYCCSLDRWENARFMSYTIVIADSLILLFVL